MFSLQSIVLYLAEYASTLHSVVYAAYTKYTMKGRCIFVAEQNKPYRCEDFNRRDGEMYDQNFE